MKISNAQAALVACLALLVGAAMGSVLSRPPTITAANENAVAFSDGHAEFIVNDDVPDQVPHAYVGSAGAIWNDSYHAFVPPMLKLEGGDWHREVYTYAQAGSEECRDHIFYMDRIHKQVRQPRTDFCVNDTLDKKDITHFFGVSPDGTAVAVGKYEDGTIESSKDIPGNLAFSGGVVSNWEMTRLVFAAGRCDPDEQSMKIFLWDRSANTLTDKTPRGFDCSNPAGFTYDHDSDRFFLTHPGDFGSKATVL